MFLFGEVIGYLIFFSVTKIFPKMLLVKKQSPECYWWKNDPSNVISEKTIPQMLLVNWQKNLMIVFGEVIGYMFFFSVKKYSKNGN